MNKEQNNTLWVLIALAAIVFVFHGGSAVSTAPINAPSELIVVVAVAADLSPDGRVSLDKTNHGAIDAVQDFVTTHNVNTKDSGFREIDTNIKEAPTQDAQWVQDAWKQLDLSKGSQILAATSKGKGFAWRPLTTDYDSTIKLLTPLVP